MEAIRGGRKAGSKPTMITEKEHSRRSKKNVWQKVRRS